MADHSKWMQLAIMEANKCESVKTAYNVGAILIDNPLNLNPKTISGYSREIPGNTHAEQCCLIKLNKDEILINEFTTLYTTMEPCNERLSGNVII